MADLWYPGAIRDPGAAAGYAHGTTTMQSVVVHYTVGTDSQALIRDEGLAQFLATRAGVLIQFAEANAVCYHAGYPYNGRGPGIEVEYLPGQDDAIFTDTARSACAGLVKWLNTEWGIPLDYYDNPNARIADHVGFISHRSVIEDADPHTDYWLTDDWARMVAPSPSPTHHHSIVDLLEEDAVYYLYCQETSQLCTVDQFRVAGYSVKKGQVIPAEAIPVTRAELMSEVTARQALVTALKPS